MLELTTSCYIIPLRIEPTTPTSEKQFCLNDINSSVMPRLYENQRLRAIGMLQAGLWQNVVARFFGCHRNTILSLWRRFRQSGNTRDGRRSGRPRVTSRRQDNHIRLVHLRNRLQTSSLTARSIPGLRPISSRTYHQAKNVPQSVQFCCLDIVQLGWRGGVDVIWDSEYRIGPTSCLQMNPDFT
jgi:transposase-like protein